jgi:beta-glucosidase
MAGKETVQLYVSKPISIVERASKELKAFEKVLVAPGEAKIVTLTIPVKDLAYYDEKTGTWMVERGDYDLLIGSSSKDIKGMVQVKVM